VTEQFGFVCAENDRKRRKRNNNKSPRAVITSLNSFKHKVDKHWSVRQQLKCNLQAETIGTGSGSDVFKADKPGNQPGLLSLAIPRWVGRVSAMRRPISKSFGVNRHTTRNRKNVGY